MKILHTVQLYHPRLGGSEEVVRQLSERLVMRGHEVTVATAFLPDRPFTEWNGVKIKSFHIAGHAVSGIQGEAQAYIDFLRHNDCDVMMNYAAQIWSSDLAFALLDTLPFKKVFVPCGYSALYHPAFTRYFAELPGYLRKYDKLVHLSPNYRDIQFSRANGLQNYVIIPNAAAEEEFLTPAIGFRERYGIRTRHMILCVANHYQAKGHDRVIQWFKALNRSDVTLVIIGQKVDGECYAQCLAGAQGRADIRLLTDVPRAWVVSAYKEADLFLFGSAIECFPLVILETMAARTPFVATEAGNIGELPGGVVCPPERAVEHVQRLLDDDAQRKDLGEIGHREWLARYTWEKVVDQYEALYQSLAGRKRSMETALPRTPQPAPKVSVVIPCYNHSEYLPEAVESVTNQSHQDFEIIIMDDGSRDETPAVSERLLRKYPTHTIRYVRQENQGLASARNNGIRQARGQYILPLDADDIIRTTFLEETVRILDSRPEVDIVYTFQQRFGEENGVFAQEMFQLHELCENNRLNYCSLFRKKVWEITGGYNPNMKWGYEDWDFWIGAAEKGARFEVIRQPLFLYRIRRESMFGESLKHDAELRAQMARNHPALYAESTRRWADLYAQHLADPDNIEINAQLVQHFLDRGNWPQALPHIIHCLKGYPDNADLNLMLGVGLLKCGDARRAEAPLQSIVDAQPNHLNALFHMGICELLLEKDEEAERYFEDVIELKPDWPDTYALLASLRLLKSRSREADCLLSDALNFEPCAPAIRRFIEDKNQNAQQAAEFYLQTILNQNLSFNSHSMLEARPDLRVEKDPSVWRAEAALQAVEPSIHAPGAHAPARDESREGDIQIPDVPATKMVSVIIPTHNRPSLLVEAIQSVLNQSYKDFEIIVVNDGGTEVEGIVQLLNQDGRITYVRHPHNQGLAAARNSGLRLARGKYIAYLDDDDVFYSDHLETLVSYLEVSGEKVAYTDAYRALQVAQNGNFITVRKDLPYSRDFDADALLVGNYIPVLCIMHARECLEKSGLFDERLKANEDYDLWIRVSRHYAFHHIKKTTAEFRARNDGSNMTIAQVAYCYGIELFLYQKYREYAKDKPEVREAQRKHEEFLRKELARFESQAAARAGEGHAVATI